MASVLVVDDDAASREYLRTLFTHGGHRVYEAADGDIALHMVDQRRPDAVITDVLMPGMDGCELVRTLRSRPQTESMPIAFNTAHYDRRVIQPMARACGVRDVIYKPATPAAVLAVMNAMLERGSAPRAAADAGPGRDGFLHRRHPARNGELSQTATAEHTTYAREARLHHEVAHLQDRLAEIQNLTRAGAWRLEPDTGVVALSPELAERIGLASPRLPRRQLWRHIHPEDRGRFAAIALGVLRDGRPRTTRLRMVGAGGAEHDLVMAVHATWADGRRTLRGAAQDITQICYDQRLRVHTHAMRQAERLMRDQLHAAMVPRELPLVAALDLAAVYLTAMGRNDTGGDWYDSLPLPDGRILLSVGAVAGHRMPGPAVAGPMRAVLRAYAVKNPDPADVLADMNEYLLTTEFGSTYVTALAALYDPGSGRLDLANAGHPLPLVITHDSGTGIPRVQKLGTPDPPLGIRPGVAFHTHRITLTPDTTVCAYTDGLTDHYTDAESDVALLIGTITAALTVAPGQQHRPAAQHTLNRVLRTLMSVEVPRDDVCMVVLRAAGPPPGL